VFLLNHNKIIISWYTKNILIFALAIFGAHGLAFFLINFLPTAAEVMLGIYGIQHDTLATLTQLTCPRTYGETLIGVFHLDFGISADGVLVETELYNNLLISFPRIFFAIFFAFIIAFFSASFAGRIENIVLPFFSYVLFIPSYGIPFILFSLLMVTNARLNPNAILPWLACALSVAIPASAMLASQAYIITKKNLTSQYAINFLSLGVTPRRLRRLLYSNLIYEITPTFEKVMTGIMTGLMFSEMIFGLPGIGTLAIRAIRRSDIELLLGIVIVFATLICIARLISMTIISLYREGIWQK
jgi:ABC-type dipeptide/oligopeptide/nickel transport system permease component